MRSRWPSAGRWRCSTSGTPSILTLTRQGLPALRTAGERENLSAKGAYVLAEASGGKRDVTILATGSEVSLAMEAREQLGKSGVQAAVVSMPCWELFAAQPESYRKAVLGSAPRVAVEAAVGMGWERWIGDGGHLHRHEQLRSVGAGAQAVRALRHHRHPRGGGGTQALGLKHSCNSTD